MIRWDVLRLAESRATSLFFGPTTHAAVQRETEMNERSRRLPNNPHESETTIRRGGPRTPRGKDRSKLNALKTGIFAKVVLTAEPFRVGRIFEQEAQFLRKIF